MNPWFALGTLLAAGWHAWWLLAVRTAGWREALPLLLVGATLALPWLRTDIHRRSVPMAPLTLLLAAYVLAILFLPPLARIAPAALAVAWCLHAAIDGADRLPRPPFFGLVALALPVVPSLEFFCGYPVRLAALHSSVALLRVNGVAVEAQGLALEHTGRLIEFDAPCSGVRMLWTCWFLASALAYLFRLGAWPYAKTLLAATGIAFASNVVRATSLFYLEARPLSFEPPAWLHEAVGVAAFVLTALAICAWMARRHLARSA